MPIVLSENGQTRCRNCYKSSAQARLTLRVNGEEEAAVLAAGAVAFVPAGFDAPTATPTIGTNGAGNVPIGFYVYRYVYASSQYPFVPNAVTGGGEEWPRSNPSPASSVYQVTPAAESNSVTVTYSTRSDVDWIWVYRTAVQTTSALATAQDNAGVLFYVGRIANNTAGGTVAFTDNSATNTGEQMEADNFPCPLFRQQEFDGFYWWGWGSRTAAVVVTLNGTTTISIDTAQSSIDTWFSGRDGYTISFYGITTGGYDGRGNYYFQRVTATTAMVYNDAALATPETLPATGTTTAYLSSPSTTLYRSKNLNPFSWGETSVQITPGTNTKILVPVLFAEQIGGGVGTAISLIPNERILKLDTESPERSYALDLNAAESSEFLGTLRTLDAAQSVGSQFSQFPMRLDSGQSVGTGINAKALQILSGDAQSQIPIGSNVINTLRAMRRENEEALFYHGVYDRTAELNCWWVKTTDGDWRCDTLIYQHAPTGTWGTKYTPGVSASTTLYDPVTETYYSFVGTEGGLIGAVFYSDRNRDWILDYLAAPAGTAINQGGVLQFTAPILNSVASISSFDGVVTITTTAAANLAPGDVFAVSQSPGFGHYIILTVAYLQFPDEVSCYYPGLPDGSLGTGGCIVNAFTLQPVVAYRSLLDNFFLLNGIADASGVTLSSSSGGVATYSFALSGGTGTGINLNTGEYASADVFPLGDSTTLYYGQIPCFTTRYFNSSTPEKNKSNVEVWATLQNVETNWLKFMLVYRADSGGTSAGYLQQMLQDVVGAESGAAGLSDTWRAMTPPSIMTYSFGVSVRELGYGAYQMMDFTLKQKVC